MLCLPAEYTAHRRNKYVERVVDKLKDIHNKRDMKASA